MEAARSVAAAAASSEDTEATGNDMVTPRAAIGCVIKYAELVAALAPVPVVVETLESLFQKISGLLEFKRTGTTHAHAALHIAEHRTLIWAQLSACLSAF